MDHAVIIKQKQQRIDAEKQQRSDAINREITRRDIEIERLRADRLSAWIGMGILFVTVIALSVQVAKLKLGV